MNVDAKETSPNIGNEIQWKVVAVMISKANIRIWAPFQIRRRYLAPPSNFAVPEESKYRLPKALEHNE